MGSPLDSTSKALEGWRKSSLSKEKFSIFDWIAFTIGFIVVGFITFILLWPLIDPTPDRSANIHENLNALTQSEKQD